MFQSHEYSYSCCHRELQGSNGKLWPRKVSFGIAVYTFLLVKDNLSWNNNANTQTLHEKSFMPWVSLHHSLKLREKLICYRCNSWIITCPPWLPNFRCRFPSVVSINHWKNGKLVWNLAFPLLSVLWLCSLVRWKNFALWLAKALLSVFHYSNISSN